MPTGSRKSVGNLEINRGSILLLFTDHEAKIVRDWQPDFKIHKLGHDRGCRLS